MDEPHDNRITALGETKERGAGRVFGIQQPDRRHHVYTVGKTGTGKSTLLETMLRQDIAAGAGAALVDPHGDLAERILDWFPEERRDDLIVFDVTDREDPPAFNPLGQVPPDKRALTASQLVEVFHKIWSHSWGPRLEHILRHALLALLNRPQATLDDVLRMLEDEDFRERTAKSSPNPQVRRFWLEEFPGYPKRLRGNAMSPIQNKVGAFVANPILRGILTQPASDVDLREIMDEGKVLVVNLAKGQVGPDNAALLGGLLVTRMGLEALGRAEVPKAERRDFHFYLDEFHNFTTHGLASMLSELRKYRLNLTLAHQHLAQLDEEVQEAILGNVGTTAAFRIGPRDAEILERDFAPEFAAEDLTQLPNYHVYLKLMIEGTASRPFAARTLPPKEISESDRSG